MSLTLGMRLCVDAESAYSGLWAIKRPERLPAPAFTYDFILVGTFFVPTRLA